jgi:hypothetical protein
VRDADHHRVAINDAGGTGDGERFGSRNGGREAGDDNYDVCDMFLAGMVTPPRRGCCVKWQDGGSNTVLLRIVWTVGELAQDRINFTASSSAGKCPA